MSLTVVVQMHSAPYGRMVRVLPVASLWNAAREGARQMASVRDHSRAMRGAAQTVRSGQPSRLTIRQRSAAYEGGAEGTGKHE